MHVTQNSIKPKATRTRSRSRVKKTNTNTETSKSKEEKEKAKVQAQTQTNKPWSIIDVRLLCTLIAYHRLKQHLGECYTIILLVLLEYMYRYQSYIYKNVWFIGQLGITCIHKHAWSSLHHATTMLKSFCEMSKSLTLFSLVTMLSMATIGSVFYAIHYIV